MKQLLSLVLLSMLLTACCKDKPEDPDDMNVPGLPPVTQTGQNTLGFLLNGQPWTPEGNNGTANLSIDFDPGFNNGIVGIAAYRKNASDDSFITFGIRDSLNFIRVPQAYRIGVNQLGGVLFEDRFFCERSSRQTNHYSNGSIIIKKLDRTNAIISGTFEATLFNPLCGDTIRITKGRFDMRF